MPRRTHPGRPGTRSLPADWQQRLNQAAAYGLTGRCEIRGPETRGVASTVDGSREAAPGPLRHSGRCRVQRLDRANEAESLAEQQIRTAGYLIEIEHDSDAVRTGDLVTVTADADPRLLVGVFKVLEVAEGSIRLKRNLYCSRTS